MQAKIVHLVPQRVCRLFVVLLVVELHHAGAILGLERGVRLEDDNEGEKDADPLDDGKEHVEPNPTQTMQR